MRGGETGDTCAAIDEHEIGGCARFDATVSEVATGGGGHRGQRIVRGQPVVVECGRFVGNGSVGEGEVGATEYPHARSGCMREQSADVGETLEKQCPTARLVTEVVGDVLHRRHGRDPGATPGTEDRKIVLGHEESVFDRVDPCCNRPLWRLGGRRVDGDAPSTGVCGSCGRGQLTLVEVGNRTDTAPGPVPHHLHPGRPVGGQVPHDRCEVVGGDLVGDAAVVAAPCRQEATGGLDGGTIVVGDAEHEFHRADVMGAFVRHQRDPAAELHRTVGSQPIEHRRIGGALHVADVAGREVGMRIDETGERHVRREIDHAGRGIRGHEPTVGGDTDGADPVVLINDANGRAAHRPDANRPSVTRHFHGPYPAVLMLRLMDLSKTYGDVTALDGCSFEVPRGALLGFLGPNGAGKTTAMRSTLGLVRPDSGSVTWNGEAIDGTTRLRFGYMPEQRGLYPRMRIGTQLRYFGQLHGLSKAEAAAATDRWLDKLGLAERTGSRLEDLSHGNQQRIQLAAALVHDPELLILDEPFSGLDPLGVQSMAEILAERAASGVAVVFSSHQLDLVEDLCDSVVVINRGRVVLSGDVVELRGRSPHRFVDVAHRDPHDHWYRDLEDVELLSDTAGHVRLRVAAGADPTDILAAARSHGPLTHFSFAAPSLSEVFREAVGQ